jgi:hypothetical protein
MARSIQQLKQDLTVIEDGVANLAIELHSAYVKYLKSLSASTRKQLILGTYQLCTNIYPEQFLKISFSQRENLQKKVRELGQKIEAMLLKYLDIDAVKKKIDSTKKNDLLEQMLDNLSLPQEKNQEGDNKSWEQETEVNYNKNSEQEEIKEERDDRQLERQVDLGKLTEELPRRIVNPDELLQWSKSIHKGIYKTLEKISKDVNAYLQESDILPNKLPGKIIEVAMQAEENIGSIDSPPNLLNFAIETNNDRQTEEHNITKITVLRLSLSEIEFTDRNLSAQHQQIRQIIDKIAQQRQKYQQNRQECAIAEAESAWRSSWYED